MSCTSLQSIEIPSLVTCIGGDAFCGCDSLKSVELPSSLTDIEAGAFRECGSLTSIEIPSSVTRIGASAFADCNSLSEAIVPYKLNYCGDDIFPKQTKIKDHNGKDRPLYKTSGDYKYALLNQSYTVLLDYTGKSKSVGAEQLV